MIKTQHEFSASATTSQDVITSNLTAPHNPPTIKNGHITISQLLGRDYVFMDTRSNCLVLNTEKQISSAIEDIATQLALIDSYALFISVSESSNGEMVFVRHETGWHNRRIVKLESVAIKGQDQQEFMFMIWQCSASIIE